jgi:hypothetical protein
VAVVGGLSIWLWHDGWVDKAELVMESKPDDGFLRARCSACPNVRFDLAGNTLSQKVLMRKIQAKGQAALMLSPWRN